MSGRAVGERLGKGGSLGVVTVAYVTALGAAWLVAAAIGSDRPVWALVGGYVVSALVIYVWSMALDNGSMFDPWWSVLPAAAAVWLVCTAPDGAPTWRSALVLVVVGLWSIRLTANWARDWPGLDHEDWRYLDLYTKGPKAAMSFGAVHMAPCLIVLAGSLPLVPALYWGRESVGVLDWIALVVGLVAVALELVADEQMRTFARHKSPGAVMDEGLWRYSRHPNYFGEILFWCSLWLFGLAADPGWWWTVIGPVAIIVMFLTASIPMLDERSRERRASFAPYAERTSVLIPLPPRRGTR